MWEEILDGMATGWQGTEGGRTAISPEERERNWNNSIKDLIPMGQAQTEDDIAYGVLFLFPPISQRPLRDRCSRLTAAARWCKPMYPGDERRKRI